MNQYRVVFLWLVTIMNKIVCRQTFQHDSCSNFIRNSFWNFDQTISCDQPLYPQPLHKPSNITPNFKNYSALNTSSTGTCKAFNFAENGFNLMSLTLNEHTGTHMDAPLHFSADGQAVNEIPVENLVVPLCVIDIAGKAEGDADAQVTPDDIKAYVAKHGAIPDKACVAMHSGWGKHVASDKFRNVGDDGKTMHFPGFHVEAAKMLIEETGAVGMAVDTLSLDHGPSADFATHYAWLPTNRWGIENIANLDKVPASGATLVVGAPKHKGGTGGPARIFALA
ncbi:Kynurenine formamidase [Nymphon striatum]|nr:Kynurenine formamidase [Nymphon striatum]